MRSHNQIQLFRDVIEECDFLELGFVGPSFTWSKHFEDGNSIWDILDRDLVTNNWFLKFPGRVTHLSCNSLDHLPLLVNPTSLEISPKNNIFRFEEMWLSNARCREIVGAAWTTTRGLDHDRLFFRKQINMAKTSCGGIKTVLAMFDESWKRRKEFR